MPVQLLGTLPASIKPEPGAGSITGTSALISWPAVSGATSYTVYVTPSGGSEALVGSTSGLSITASGLASDKDHTGRVVATVVSPSGIVSFRTLFVAVDSTLRNHLYMSWQAGSLVSQNYASVSSVSYQNTVIPLAPTNNWTTMEVLMFDILGAPVAPQGVWACVGDGVGGADYPDFNSSVTWVAATGLKAPPSGSDDSPGVGPVCNPIAIPPSAGKRAITIRIQMPAGNYTGMSLSTTLSLYPVGQVKPLLQSAGAIAGNPSLTTGWGESFGVAPAIMIKLNGLTTPISQWIAVGDSHTQGYLGSGSALTGVRGPFGEFLNVQAGTYPKFNVMNLGRSGHTTAQISSRLHAWVSQLDVGGVLRQRASINDRTGAPDVTTGIADASWAQLQADYAYVTGLTKRCIFYSPAGATSTFSAGWYTRFTAHLADELALCPNRINANSSLVQADGSYQSGMAAPDNGHPNQTGLTTWGAQMEPAFRAMLTAEGISF
jgi:lysophospholipase L1-like esterase